MGVIRKSLVFVTPQEPASRSCDGVLEEEQDVVDGAGIEVARRNLDRPVGQGRSANGNVGGAQVGLRWRGPGGSRAAVERDHKAGGVRRVRPLGLDEEGGAGDGQALA